MVVLITGGKPVRLRTVPSTLALSIKLALGVALIVLAAVQWRHRNRARRTPAWLATLDTMSPWTAAVIAAIMQPWTLVAAAAVTAAQARLSGVGGYLALASFCLLATSSFIVLELYAAFAPAVARVPSHAAHGDSTGHRRSRGRDAVAVLAGRPRRYQSSSR